MAFDPPLPSVMRSRQIWTTGADVAMASRVPAYGMLLVPLMGDPADRAALDMSVAVGGPMHAHIVGLHVQPRPADLLPPGTTDRPDMPVRMIEQYKHRESLRTVQSRTMFSDWQASCGIATAAAPRPSGVLTAQWIDLHGPILDTIASQARTADMVVIGRAPRDYAADHDAVLDGALLCSGRPALIVPGSSTTDPFEVVIIAWNNSREAARAVGAAWPLIARARRIIVFIRSDGGSLRPFAETFASRFAWRGLAAATVVDGPPGEVGEALLETARRENAGLIVMGAYTYSRLQELVFGDVTRHVLVNATIPTLMLS